MIELNYNEIHHTRRIPGTEQAESMEDRRFNEILTRGLHKNTEGNWEAPLTFKTDDVLLPDNKGHCLRRLLSLKRRLLNYTKLKDDYLTFMKKTLDNGHASQVPVDQLQTTKGKAWYLPHFHVYHPQKPDQIHIVFDCSTVYENESLNKHQLQGPDQLNSLIGVLTHFRKEEELPSPVISSKYFTASMSTETTETICVSCGLQTTTLQVQSLNIE